MDNLHNKIHVLDCLNEVQDYSTAHENIIGRPEFDRDNNIRIDEESLKMKNFKYKTNFPFENEKKHVHSYNETINVLDDKLSKEEKKCKKEYKENKIALWKYLIKSSFKIDKTNSKKIFLVCTHSHRIKKFLFEKFDGNKFNNCFCMGITFKKTQDDIIEPVAKVVFKGFPEEDNCKGYDGPYGCKHLHEADILPIKAIITKGRSDNISKKSSNNSSNNSDWGNSPKNQELRILRAIKYKHDNGDEYSEYLENKETWLTKDKQTKYYDVLGEFQHTETIKNKLENELNRIKKDYYKFEEKLEAFKQSNENISELAKLEGLMKEEQLAKSIMKSKKENSDENKNVKIQLNNAIIEINNSINAIIKETPKLKTFKNLFEKLNKKKETLYDFFEYQKNIINIINHLPKEISEKEYIELNEKINTKYVSVYYTENRRNPKTHGEDDLARVKLQQKDSSSEFEIDVDKIFCLNEHDLITKCTLSDGYGYLEFKPTNYDSEDNKKRIIRLNEEESKSLLKTKFYIIRHGDSFHNENYKKKEFDISKTLHRFTDSSLTPIGIAQASYLGSLLQNDINYFLNGNASFIYLMSSYLNRAQHTGLQTLANMYPVEQLKESYNKLYNLSRIYNIMAINRIFYNFNRDAQKIYDLFKHYDNKILNTTINNTGMRKFIQNCLVLKQITYEDYDEDLLYIHKYKIKNTSSNYSRGGSRISKKYSKTLKKKMFNKRKTSMKKRKLRN